MFTTARKSHQRKILVVFFIITTISIPVYGVVSTKIDDDITVSTSPVSAGVQCGSCSSCNDPCYQIPPPPPPLLPPPPPPKKKKPATPSSPYCPPPPTSGFIYVSGPPGNLYPIDPFYAGAGRNFAVGMLSLIGCGLIGLLAF